MTVRERVLNALESARRYDPVLRALITGTGEQALRDADRLDSDGGPRGKIRGLSVSLKDNIDLAGVPTTAGSTFIGDEPEEADAAVTNLLRERGAVFVAKTNMAEWAMGVTTRNRVFGQCRNPWDVERIPGGSSGGSAVAVATGMSEISLGTDTGGSVRIPAAVCGVTGLRPTLGRVSNRGVRPVSTSFDTVGPMARDVRLVADVMATLDEFDDADPTSAPGERTDVKSRLEHDLNGMRIGVPGNFFFDGIDPGVRAIVNDAIAALVRMGAATSTVHVPGAEHAQQRTTEILYPEAAAFHAQRIAGRATDFDHDVLRRLRIGEETTSARTRSARKWQVAFQENLDVIFRDVDIVATPTVPLDVPPIAGLDLAAAISDIGRFTYAWSLYGGPSISLPCGLHPESGMPVGLQLSAARWHEHLLFQAGARLQDDIGQDNLWPPILN